MFQFSPLSSTRLCIQREIVRHNPDWVAPFGNPRIKACLQLTVAFRSLPRPSSSTHAKASTIRS